MDEVQARLKLLRGNPRPPGMLTEAERRRYHGVNPTPDAYRAICGASATYGGACRGLLGTATWDGAGPAMVAQLVTSQVARHEGRGRIGRDDWILEHPDGFRRLDDGSYGVLTKGKKNAYGMRIGRRPVPEALKGPKVIQGKGYAIVGQFPVLPAVVACPMCGRRNVIPKPPASCRYGHQQCTRGCPPPL